jgi:carbamoyltransferase
MNILGLNVYHGDAAAALISDGKVSFAAEEERFNRIKHCAGLPTEATKYALDQAGIKFSDLDAIAVSRNPRANLFHKLWYAGTHILKGQPFLKGRIATAVKIRSIKEDLCQALGQECPPNIPVHFIEHHFCHMASSFFVSPFEEAAILSIDGFGDFVSTKIGYGKSNQIRTLGQVTFPHSLGLLYTAICQYIGFPHYGDEGKVMGLAPYGEPIYLDEFKKIVHLTSKGLFRLNLDYFLHHKGGIEMSWLDGNPIIGKLYSPKLVDLLGPEREKGAPLEKRHKDIAASLQVTLEHAYFEILKKLHAKTKVDKLCLSGGVALNSVCNGKLFKETPFKEAYIQPASGDGGTALGAALSVWHQKLRKPRSFHMEHAYTGPCYKDEEIEKTLTNSGVSFRKLTDDALFPFVAQSIADGKVIGWFQGNMEFGPRALGNRSILVDPRRHDMKDILNARIKHREPFRPFAPSILEEAVNSYFEEKHPSPFMLMVYPIKKEKQDKIPAVTHVDGTGRLQTVSQKENSRYYRLIETFYEMTGVPIVLNTSFNENEPIVMSPQDALNCFQKTKMDLLALGNYIVERKEQS